MKFIFLIYAAGIFLPVGMTFCSASDLNHQRHRAKNRKLLTAGPTGNNLGPRGSRTAKSVIKKLKPVIEQEMQSLYERKGLEFPPQDLKIVILKEEKILEVWEHSDIGPVLIKEYPILAASGGPGPKLKRGDYQVPEGIYKVNFFHANSSFHLSMKINYPNKEDRIVAKLENRSDLGGNIFIHGDSVSIGCVAIGDTNIEELFFLGFQSKSRPIEVVIAPRDFRVNEIENVEIKSNTDKLYQSISTRLQAFKK